MKRENYWFFNVRMCVFFQKTYSAGILIEGHFDHTATIKNNTELTKVPLLCP